MSDESPPLRIKPRLKSENPPNAPAANVAPGGDEVAPKITLRPKLSVPSVPPPAAAVPAPSETPPPAAERPRLKPRLSTEAAAPASAAVPTPVSEPELAAAPPPAPPVGRAAPPTPEVPKFKLKPKSAEPAPATLPIVSASPPAAPEVAPAAPPEEPASPEGTPEAAAPESDPVPAPATGEAPPPPVPKLKITFPPRPAPAAPTANGAPAGAPRPSIPKAKRPRPSKIVLIGGLAAGVLVLGGGGYFAYELWFSPPPPLPPMVARPKPKPVVPLVEPSVATADQAAKPGPVVTATPVSMAGKMVDKAQTVAAGQGTAIDGSDGLLEKRPSAAPAGPNGTPKAASSDEIMDKTKASIAPGILATTSDVVVTTEASPAFRAWAANVKIAGVFPGRTPPRAFINSRAVDAGQIVDDALGIIFESVDTDKNVLVFRDKSGAKVMRKF
jgi:hypothetical protein